MEETVCSYEGLMYDQACVLLTNTLDVSEAWLYSLSSDCHLCPYKRISQTSYANNESITFSTARSLTWRIRRNGDDEYISSSNKSDDICDISPNLGQFGLYELSVSNDSCSLHTIKEPSSVYKPLLIVFAAVLCALLGFSLLRSGINILKRSITKRSANPDVEETPVKRRIKSIDTFRGISILFMIFVNDGAGGYVILEHATWDGLLFGDFIFPCFMWIMGVCIPISVLSQLSRQTSRFSLLQAIVKRSIVLFIIGISLNTLGATAQLEKIRLFGVLQRFSIAYLAVAGIFVLLSKRTIVQPKNSMLYNISDILAVLPHWAVIIGVVVAHCSITFLLPVPGCPTGYLGPGGRHDDGKYPTCVGGAAGYVDRIVLGSDHIYQTPTANSVYGSGPFEPEGVLGCLTSILQVFLGAQAGMILKYYKEWKNRTVRWLAWAAVCGIVGASLHYSDIIPVNKNLWSLSFVMVTSCFGFVLLTFCYILVDVADVWQGGPFRIPGMNALVMYVGHQLCFQIFPFHWTYGSMNTHAWKLVETLWGVGLWTIVAYILHRKKIYVSL